MALDSYTNLKTAIADWTHRSTLTSYLDDFILMAEELMTHEPRPPDDPDIGGVRVAITEATGNLTAGQAYISKPADFLSPIRFDLTGTNGNLVVYAGPDAIPSLFVEGNGRPKFWTVTNVIEFNRAPDSTYAYSLKYWSQPTALSGSNADNTILTNYPMCYLYGCLHFAYDFLQDDANSSKYLAKYKAAAWGASQRFQQSLHSQGAIASMPG